jgi:membrane protein YdbS with pleckstrin-like domain
VAYPDKVLADDEEVVRHLHPHWLTVFWPVVGLLVIVGLASFGTAAIPAGPQQGIYRLAVVGAALLLILWLVVRPFLVWRCTHYVITTHRVLFRQGVLARRGRDIGLSRITDVSYRQTLWERIVSSGTVTIESAGEGGATVLERIPDSDGVQQLLNHMIEEDADRRTRGSSGYPLDHPGHDEGYEDDGYEHDGYEHDGYEHDGYEDDGYADDGWGGDGRRDRRTRVWRRTGPV